MRRFRPLLSFHLALLATVLIVVLTPAEGRADGIPHSEPTLEGNLAGAPGCRSGTPGPACRPLLDPGSPGDDPADALAALGRPGSPEDDLAAALRAMRSAPDAAAAGKAADEARAILAGEPLEGRAYSGIPLLNWNVPARVRRVPAGGAVTVTVVRHPRAQRRATRGCSTSRTRPGRTRSPTGSASWAGRWAASCARRRC